MKKITVKLNRYYLDISTQSDADEYRKIKDICYGKNYKLFDILDTALIGIR